MGYASGWLFRSIRSITTSIISILIIQVKLAEIKKEYDAAIEPLEPLYIQRPPKPAPKPKEEAKPAEPAPAAKEAPAPEPVSA